MKIVLLDAMTLGDADLSAFNALGEFKAYPTTQPQETLQRIKDADIILTNKVVLNKEILQQAKNLKLIAITATGTNIIDIEAAKELNIEVKNVAGYSTKSVAQHTLTMALMLLSQITYYDSYCKRGAWIQSQIFTHLSGGLNGIDKKSWGIIGLGEIGREVARLASAFGAQVSYTSISGNAQNTPYKMKDLQSLLKESDIISIHSPLTPKTHNLITKNELALLKDEAVLINSGRGGIVNEDDLANELKKRKLYFGSDVLEVEPMKKDHPFLDPQIQDQILLTPHIAWAYGESKDRLIKKVYENVKNFIQKA